MPTDLRMPDPSPAEAFVARGREALKLLRPQMDALTEAELVPINVDVTMAVSRALGVLPAVAAMRERIRTCCPQSDQDAIDQLEDRAYAASSANGAHETATTVPGEFDAVVTEVFDARNVLLQVGRGLVACNIIKAEQLGGLNGGRGYRESAADLIALTDLYSERWSAIEGRVPFQEGQVTHARAVAERLAAMVGVRELMPEHSTPTADTRIRAFTLLDRAYDELRRAITYLRWREDDADVIAPSFRSQQFVRRNSDDKNGEKNGAKPAGPDAPVKPGTSPTDISKSDGTSTFAPAPAGPSVVAPAKPEQPVDATKVLIGRAPSGASLGSPFTEK